MEKLERHWRRVRRMTGWLLAVWLLATFCIIFFPRELSGLSIFGWPLSFYMAAQGSLIVYVVLIYVYAKRMRKLDLEYNVEEGDE